jgi:hypothetical protein
LYTLELCRTSRQKALCGVLLSVLGNLGTLLTYVLGVFLDWRTLALALMTLSLPYVVGILVPLSQICFSAEKYFNAFRFSRFVNKISSKTM